MASPAFAVSRSSLNGPSKSTILVTGAANGIGLETVKILHELGNNIIALDRSPPSSSVPQSLTSSSRFLFQQCDVTSWPSQRDAFEAGAERFGGIDGVFVNAGIAEYGDQFFNDELDAQGKLKEPDRRTTDIDLRFAADTIKLAIYHMRRNPDKKGGSIVCTASLAGYLASAGAPLYSGAKHGRSCSEVGVDAVGSLY